MDPRSHTSHPSAWLALGLTTALGVGAFSACNKHVFRVVPADCVKEQQKLEPLETGSPADILIVVDNSASMCEEQRNLAENFFDPRCDIDISQPIPPEERNPTPERVQELTERCGFIQILALFDKDFRLGVITTDASQCDNDFNTAATSGTCDGELHESWGRRPQRGCLQGFGEERKFLQTGDARIGDKFRSILANVQTFGSPFERGLDALEAFLDPDAVRAPGCERDLEGFLRDDAKLVVIFLTDEDDCSDGLAGYPKEMAGETCEDGRRENFDATYRPEHCYEHPERLAPVSRYVDFLLERKGPGNVQVAVIAGGLEGPNGIEPAGCRVDDDTGAPVGGCYESGGSSNATGPQGDCNPQILAEQGIDEPCCEADPGTRYYELARALGGDDFEEDSICHRSFRSTMVKIAQFIGRTTSVRLDERPVDPAAILVRILRAGAEEPELIPRIPDGEPPAGRDGWQHDGDRTIHFHGAVAPQPGDSILVAALDDRDADAGPDAGPGCIAPAFGGDAGADGGG